MSILFLNVPEERRNAPEKHPFSVWKRRIFLCFAGKSSGVKSGLAGLFELSLTMSVCSGTAGWFSCRDPSPSATIVQQI